MAINFAAENMAGYNNPKIEVFKAIMDNATHIISDAPNKQEIIRCLCRGSIPALVVVTPDRSEINMVWMAGYYTDSEGEGIAFGESPYQILYPPSNEQPIFNS